jgi:Uma2 family endonuclease
MNAPHAIACELTADVLRGVFPTGWRIRGQLPLALGQDTDPGPDFAVVPGSPRGAAGHPATAALVIEISDTTLDYDLTTKAELYATAGIADYWVLDLNGLQLVVYRDPQPLSAGLGATAYRTRLTFGPADAVTSLAAPLTPVKVADLLP